MKMFRVACFSLVIGTSISAHADLSELWTMPLKHPSPSDAIDFQNKCGIRMNRIENPTQAGCLQEKRGRWYAENNQGAIIQLLKEYRDDDVRGRAAQERAFVEKCVAASQNGTTWGVDTGCSGLIKGFLDAGLPRDEFGIVGETAPPSAPKPQPYIRLGEMNMLTYTLAIESILKTANSTSGLVTIVDRTDNSVSDVKYAANCSEGKLSEDAGKPLDASTWRWSKPRFDVEKTLLNTLCAR